MPVPSHVIDHVRRVFRRVNSRVAKQMCRVPTTHESFLDQLLITNLDVLGQPFSLEDGWSVRIETHFLGGMRHWKRWEVADIGVLVTFRSGGRPVRTKLACFQSKRLYPNELTHEDEERAAAYEIGFARLYRDGQASKEQLAPRTFGFDRQSRYRAISIGDQQQATMATYMNERKVPLYYLLYNPAELPWTTTLPATVETPRPNKNRIGCRVLPLDLVSASGAQGATPSYANIVASAKLAGGLPNRGWRLEKFVADRLVGCVEGYRARRRNDDTIDALFNRRGGPIASAFSITIDGPAGAMEDMVDD